MEIHKCGKKEIASAGAFYDRVVIWLDNHINYPKWICGVYPSETSVREMTASGSQYICLNDGKIMGAFVLNADPQGNYQNGNWSESLPDGEYMVLHAMAVAPELNGQGLGSEIIRFCAEKAKNEGYKALRADVVPDNYPAKGIFTKNGFTYAGDADLERGLEDIPVFSLFELNL